MLFFLLALAITIVLVLIGAAWILGSDHSDPSASTPPTATTTPTPTITPTVNPALTVNVLNGTGKDGLAAQVGSVLTKAGWKVGSVADASSTNITATTIYYSNPANKAAALGVQKSIPNATLSVSQAFVETGADITVVVGSNYKPTS